MRIVRILSEGMVITIEPFLSTKSRVVTESSDGWTLLGMYGNCRAIRTHDDHYQGRTNRRGPSTESSSMAALLYRAGWGYH